MFRAEREARIDADTHIPEPADVWALCVLARFVSPESDEEGGAVEEKISIRSPSSGGASAITPGM